MTGGVLFFCPTNFPYSMLLRDVRTGDRRRNTETNRNSQDEIE